MPNVDTVILGAGLTGLSAALHLGTDYLVLEKESRAGGLTRTDVRDGFHFDCTGHWLHLRDERMKALVSDLLGDNLAMVERRSKVYSHGVVTEFPFQGNLYGLPAEVIFRCVWGAIESHMEGDQRPEPGNFEEFSRSLFGEGITEEFMVPYNRKLWGCDLNEISAAWCGRFFPRPNLEQIVRGAFGINASMGYNVRFVYPREGGIESLPVAMLDRVSEVRCDSAPERICTPERWLEVGGERISYRRLVSSIPLPVLVDAVEDAPDEIREARDWLRCTSLRYVNYGLRGEVLDGAHWLYIPDPDLPFYRVGCSSNAMPSLAPPGCSALYVEIGNDHDLPGAEVLASIRRFFKDVGAISSDEDVLVEELRTISHGYVIFDERYDEALARIMPWLESCGIISTGRYGAWVYSSMEDALLDGMRAARQIAAEREELK
jgi:protoporphyrinogen oxidase